MIEIRLRKNLLYLFTYYIFWIVNLALEEIVSCSFYIYLLLTIVGKILGGLIIYFYQYHLTKRKKQSKYFGINLIYNAKKVKVRDGTIKIGLLLFFASFFYVFRFIVDYQFVCYLVNSPSINFRLSSIQTISAALICTYALGFEMKKHHKVSLIIISICLALTFILEIIYKLDNINLNKFTLLYFLILYFYICETFSNCIEKYLVDINYINPFLILLLEGIIELILAIFYILLNDNFTLNNFIYKALESVHNKFLILLICLLIIYPIVAAITNIYKIYCNVIYSPMARSLINYLLNPPYNIYSFILISDFNRNIFYLVISIIICIIIAFFGCVFNEYIILYFCGLENETKDIIAERALKAENVPKKSLETIINDNESEDDDDKNKVSSLK